ncbi:FadR/GntR family transcriptional regulator [Virgibacillus sp. W0181]|uniref:FadR/GntR family transcriptional regulator n=1 Tax=Virgibacillus sp. W0181 TaxID=3391581 RepID=UPI003F470612
MKLNLCMTIGTKLQGVRNIENVKLSQLIVKEIMLRIETGEYPLFSRLPSENKLAEKFKVGRSTIRESLSVLKSLGILSSKQGGGHFIHETNLTPLINSINIQTREYQEIKYLFEVRFILESEAAFMAAERRTTDDIIQLEESLRKFKVALESPDQTGQLEDFEFHKTMINTTHNPIMIKLMDSLSDMYQKTLEITLKQNLGLNRKRQDVYKEHKNIFKAIKDGQPELAKIQCLIHLGNVQKKVNYLYHSQLLPQKLSLQ